MSSTKTLLQAQATEEPEYFEPDELIFQLDQDTSAIRNMFRPPKLELPYFDGNPLV